MKDGSIIHGDIILSSKAILYYLRTIPTIPFVFSPLPKTGTCGLIFCRLMMGTLFKGLLTYVLWHLSNLYEIDMTWSIHSFLSHLVRKYPPQTNMLRQGREREFSLPWQDFVVSLRYDGSASLRRELSRTPTMHCATPWASQRVSQSKEFKGRFDTNRFFENLHARSKIITNQDTNLIFFDPIL